MSPNQSHDDEEDFFAMLGEEEPVTAPALKSLATGSGAIVKEPIVAPRLASAVEPGVTIEYESDLVESTCHSSQPMPVHHILSSESDNDLPLSAEPAEPTDKRFEETLRAFYHQYNFGNLDKVPYLAEKFHSRRWELWEQLSIKYRLSPRESRSLWIDFNIYRDGVSECARKLFSVEEIVSVQDDSIEQRRLAWKKMLNVDSSDSQKALYHKYRTELRSTEAGDDCKNDITRDVHRTHQELGFFQEVCYMMHWTLILIGKCEKCVGRSSASLLQNERNQIRARNERSSSNYLLRDAR